MQRRYTCVIPGHTYEGKFGLPRMLGGYVSERYPPIKVFPINRRRNGGGDISILLSVDKCEFVWITSRDVDRVKFAGSPLVFSLLCLLGPGKGCYTTSEEIVLGERGEGGGEEGNVFVTLHQPFFDPEW